MKIRFSPQPGSCSDDRALLTEIGWFRPGEERELSPHEYAAGRRLIANGEFVGVDPVQTSALGDLVGDLQPGTILDSDAAPKARAKSPRKSPRKSSRK